MGYLELWSFFNNYGTVTQQDIDYIQPYNELTLSFIVLWSQPDSAHPILPPSDSSFDGNFYYGGAPIVQAGSIVSDTPRAKEFWSIANQWSSIAQQYNKKFIISFGGWLDIQATPRLSSGKAEFDLILKGIDALANSSVKFSGLDFDWEHLAVVNQGGSNVELSAEVALDKCMFLGYLLAAIKAARPDLLLTYTTRSNTFYPFVNKGSNGTLWGSDREGVGVALGIYFYAKFPNYDWSVGDFQAHIADLGLSTQMRAFTPLSAEVQSALQKTLYGVNLMAYDGAVGTLAQNGCYSLDDYDSVLSRSVEISGSPKILMLGFEPIKQAAPCSSGKPCNSFCDFNKPGLDGLDVSAVKSAATPLFELINSKKIAGIFIWGMNEFAGEDNSNVCLTARTGKCMADYALVLARAYADFQGFPGQKCAWYQTRDPKTGSCFSPLCTQASLRAQKVTRSALIGGIALIVVGIVLGIVAVKTRKYVIFAPASAAIVGGILLIIIRPKLSSFCCDKAEGCVTCAKGSLTLAACQESCPKTKGFKYNSKLNACEAAVVYGDSSDLYSTKAECEHKNVKYACQGPGICNPDLKGMSYSDCVTSCAPPSDTYRCDASTGSTLCIPDPSSSMTLEDCKAKKVSYVLDESSLVCLPSCADAASAVVSKSACEGTIPFSCVAGQCNPQRGGSFIGQKECAKTCREVPAKCTGATISKFNPTTGKDECVPCRDSGPPYSLGHSCSRETDCTSGYCQAVNCADSADADKVKFNHDNHLCRAGASDLHCY
jgi:hypothetical protein